MLTAFLLTHLVMSAAETAWTYSMPGDCADCSPGVGDLDGDGSVDLVLAMRGGKVQALDAHGKELWHTALHGPLNIPPTVANVTGGPGLEVLVVNGAGLLVCLDGARAVPLWEWSLPNPIDWGFTSILVSDVDQDGQPEIVTGTNGGVVTCLSGKGDLVWTYTGPQGGTLCPAVGDVDGDGQNEIVVGGTKTPLVCLSHSGQEKWRYENAERGSSPVLCDLNGDKKAEIVAGVGNKVVALDGKGRVLWQVAMKGEMDAGLAVGDADGDGQIEIYAADLAGSLACIDPSGVVRWLANVEQRARRCPTLADVDGDGTVEILVAGYSSAIHVFDPSGQMKERIPLGGTCNSSPTVVDFAGDGRLSVVCPTVNGEVRAYRWPGGPGKGKVVWPEYRGNGARTGALATPEQEADVRLAELDLGNGYVGNNRFAVTVANPKRQAIAVQLSIAQNGRTVSQNALDSSEDIIEHEIPYTVTGREPVAIELSCTIMADGAVVSKRVSRKYVTPFMQEVKDFEADLAALDAALPKLVDAKGIEERVYFNESKLPNYREHAFMAGVLTDVERSAYCQEFGETREETHTLRRLAEVAVERVQAGDTTLALSAANPWAPFGGTDELAEGRYAAPALSVEAFQGEIESAALNVFNLSHLPRTFRIEVDDFQLRNGEATVAARDVVTLREVIDVPTQDRDMSADALPLLNEAKTLTMPVWGARQLWLTVKTSGLKPGTWTARIHLKSLESDSMSATSEIRVTVWNTPLPREQAMRSCGWGYVEQSILKDQPDAALDDQVGHGTNVFVGTYAPAAEFDGDGNLVGAIDFSKHDAYVKRYAPHGTILFCGYQGAMKCPAPVSSPEFAKAHVAWLKAWVAHLAELGVGYDGFALYPVDEPGLSQGLIEIFLLYGRLAREADPNIRVYTDPVKGITLDELKQIAPYVDIWCPNRGSFLLDKENEKLDFIKGTGKPVWTYECADNAKHLSPLGYYRGQAWLARRHGLTGIGFWSYCTSSDDPWFRPMLSLDYLLIYQGAGVVASKRWEAIRDGIEDYSMLNALESAADAAEKEGRAPEAVAAAKALLKEDVTDIAGFCANEGGVVIKGAEARTIADSRWEVIQAARRKIAACLEQLLAK